MFLWAPTQVLCLPRDRHREACCSRCDEQASRHGGILYNKRRPRPSATRFVRQPKYVVYEQCGLCRVRERENAPPCCQIDLHVIDRCRQGLDVQSNWFDIHLAVESITRKYRNGGGRMARDIARVTNPPKNRVTQDVGGSVLRDAIEAEPRVAAVRIIVHDEWVRVESHRRCARSINVAQRSRNGPCVWVALPSIHGHGVGATVLS